MEGLLDKHTRETTAQAFQAYNAMEATKRRHFDYLNLLDSRQKKFNLKSSDDENRLLAALLADHDRAVKAFKKNSSELLLSDPEAHRSLFSHIAMLNTVLDDTSQSDEH